MAPVDAIRRLLDSRADAATPTPGLGVDELWQQSAGFLAKLPPGTQGLVASVVRGEGPAARAGIQALDVLLEADGGCLTRIADLVRVVRRHRPGETLALKFLRPGEAGVREARVVLDRAEDVWADEP
jgi:S1-C subfamily serine protease